MIFIKNLKNEPFCTGDIRVHRGTPLGNPWTHLNHGDGIKCGSRKEAIDLYHGWLIEQVESYNPIAMSALNDIIIKHLTGKHICLACFCSPDSCHAEIISRWIGQQKYCRNWFTNMAIIEPFVDENIEYNSVENYYQAQKAVTLNEKKTIAKMTPFDAKRHSKSMTVVDTFKEIRLEIMEFALRQKFAQPFWKERLVSYDKEIIEYNNWNDTFWGVDIVSGKGKNNLGKLLTKIRLDSIVTPLEQLLS